MTTEDDMSDRNTPENEKPRTIHDVVSELVKIDKVEGAGMLLERITNDFGCRKPLGQIAFNMTREHSTLVQSFTGAFVIPFVREMAHMYRSGRFDGRNEAACEACAAMCEAIEKKYGVGPDDPLTFACI